MLDESLVSVCNVTKQGGVRKSNQNVLFTLVKLLQENLNELLLEEWKKKVTINNNRTKIKNTK